ncbi:unnamed protein product [Danaus chrysippus]|uniref:(African queen) hypothetical protein n=1 Tax=Danaus chrysippus TaxID=151541 RepID=A0A8J2W055_9NEOP|nr:unnamed protein product [Danaus chrysippus]
MVRFVCVHIRSYEFGYGRMSSATVVCKTSEASSVVRVTFTYLVLAYLECNPFQRASLIYSLYVTRPSCKYVKCSQCALSVGRAGERAVGASVASVARVAMRGVAWRVVAWRGVAREAAGAGEARGGLDTVLCTISVTCECTLRTRREHCGL